MKILFLDTSSFFVTVSIIEDGKIVYLFQDEITDDMSSKVMPIISDGFNTLDFSIKDIDKIMVVNGPGSFTGVRIGVTIAKTIAWALKKDIITISSLEFLATTQVNTKYIIPMIDARRGFVYSGVYDSELNIIKEDSYIKYEDLKDFFVDGTIISFNNFDNCAKPNLDVLKIINKHVNDECINPHAVKPNYLKKTEAEENLEKKNDKTSN